jgi:TusA-related sulfurtransferase
MDPRLRGDDEGVTANGHSNESHHADRVLDITNDVCPMTFVRTRLALDAMSPGQVLLVKLRGEEPLRNVPRTAAEQGHTVLSLEEGPDGASLLRLRRGG